MQRSQCRQFLQRWVVQMMFYTTLRHVTDDDPTWLMNGTPQHGSGMHPVSSGRTLDHRVIAHSPTRRIAALKCNCTSDRSPTVPLPRITNLKSVIPTTYIHRFQISSYLSSIQGTRHFVKCVGGFVELGQWSVVGTIVEK